MEMFFVFLLNGIVVGSVYALVAIGFSIVFSIMRIINFAHGELYMVGAYMAWLVVTRFVPNFWLGLLFAVVIGALLGFIIERLAFRRIYGSPDIAQFLVSMGVMIILQEMMYLNFTGIHQIMPTLYPTIRAIGKVTITDQRLLVVGVTLVLLVAIHLFFQRTRTGKAMRATAANRLAAGMVGINFKRMASFAFMGGAGLAAVAGTLLAPIFVINPFMGARMLMITFVVVIMGGMGSIAGAAIAGYAIGIMESFFSAYVSTQWTFSLAFVVLILVLMFRPRGLFGRD